MYLVPVQYLRGQVTAGIGQKSDRREAVLSCFELPSHIVHLLKTQASLPREMFHDFCGTIRMKMDPESFSSASGNNGISIS
jgi:non-canonical (house-cleaning) NTP pyrophosphatase